MEPHNSFKTKQRLSAAFYFLAFFIFLTHTPNISREVTHAVQCFGMNNDPIELFNEFLIPFLSLFMFLLFALSRPGVIAMLSPAGSFNIASKQKNLTFARLERLIFFSRARQKILKHYGVKK